MGCFDIISIKCCYCGKVSQSQTKLGKRRMERLNLSHRFDFKDCILLLKDKCQHCGLPMKVRIKDGRLAKCYILDKPTIKELPFGKWGEIVYDLKNDDETK